MWRKGVKVGLGSDAPALHGSLDIFRMAHQARIGQELVFGTPAHARFPARFDEYLRMAAIGGAAGMRHDGGTLEVGRAADLLLLRTDSFDAPLYREPDTFVFNAASGRDVDTVVVAGQVIVSDGRMLTIDMDEVIADASRAQSRIAELVGL